MRREAATVITLVVGFVVGAGVMGYWYHPEKEQCLGPVKAVNANTEKEQTILLANTEPEPNFSKVSMPENDEPKSNFQRHFDEPVHQDEAEESVIEPIHDRSATTLGLIQLWELDRTIFSWDDIERVAPNLTYEHKLNLEMLLQGNVEVGTDIMLGLAKYPNTGNEDRDLLYLAMGAMESQCDVSTDNVFFVDSLIEETCGRQAPPRKLMKFLDGRKTDIKRAYQKRNLSELKRIINDTGVCSTI